MLNCEVLVKIRAHATLGIVLVIFPVSVILATLYRIFEFVYKYRKFKNIAGDVAVVTGSGHGLGRCIALQLAKKGAHLAVVDINLKGAEETVQQIKAKYDVDVTDYKEVEKLKDIKKDIGVATILINNAGIVTFSNYAKPSQEEIQRMIDVNLKSHFWTNRVFLENMKECRKGHIMAISSVAGLFPLIYNSVYCATKFGVRGMMRALRLDLKALGYNDINTTVIYPSFLTTNDEVVDISNQVQIESFYPLIKGEEAARLSVHAMLRNEVEVTLPRAFALLSRIFDSFPAPSQDTLWNICNKTLMERFTGIVQKHEQSLMENNKST